MLFSCMFELQNFLHSSKGLDVTNLVEKYSVPLAPGAYRAVGHGGGTCPPKALGGGGHWGGTAVGVPANTLIHFV